MLTHSIPMRIDLLLRFCPRHVTLQCQCYCYILGRPAMDNSLNCIPKPGPVSANKSNGIFVSFSLLAPATGEILSALRTPRV